MSDLVKEAAPSLSPDTDLNKQAVNRRKLQALSSRGTASGAFAGDQASLVVDAFAEVFASMAISSPPPIKNSDSGSKSSDAGDEAVEATDQSGEAEKDDSQQNVADDTVVVAQDAGAAEFAVQAEVAKTVEAEGASEDVSVLAAEVEASDELVDSELVNESTEAAQLAVASTISQASGELEVGDQVDRSAAKDSESVDSNPVISAVDADASKPATWQSTSTTEAPSDAADAVDQQSGQPTGEQAKDQSESGNRRRYSDDEGSAGERPVGNASDKAVSATKTTTDAQNQNSESALKSAIGSHATSTSNSPVVPSASAAASAVVAAVSSASGSSGAASRGALAGTGGGNSLSAAGGTRPGVGAEQAGRPEWATNEKSAKKTDAGANKTDTLTRIKLVQRVSRAFQHLGPEGGVVRLRLAPAELGTVRVEMQIQQKKVNARVVAETDAAASALREHLPELRARLEAHGMQIESLEVETQSGDEDSSGLDHRSQNDPSSDRHAHGQRQSRSDRASRREAIVQDRAVPAPVSRQSVSLAPAGGVDIRF